MFKYLFCFLIIFFLVGIPPVRAQTSGDSVETVDAGADSLESPVETTQYRPMDAKREVPGKQVGKYLKEGDYAYANDPEYWKKEVPPKPGMMSQLFISPVVRWIIFIGVIGIILFGIYQLAKENSFSWVTRKVKPGDSGTEELLPDEKMDYETAIRKYQAEGNYRLAVRYMYLRLIRSIREKGKIQFRDSSTNAEITRAFGSHPKAGEFRFLARAYEYIFYGDFIPDQELFDMLKIKFENFQQTISA